MVTTKITLKDMFYDLEGNPITKGQSDQIIEDLNMETWYHDLYRKN